MITSQQLALNKFNILLVTWFELGTIYYLLILIILTNIKNDVNIFNLNTGVILKWWYIQLFKDIKGKMV